VNRRDEIISKIHAVPGMPVSVVEVLRMLQEPGVPLAELSRAIEYDPGLTSNVLRLANSAYFGHSRSIHSVKEAIVRLGTRNILKLVMTSAVAPVAQYAVKGYDLPPGELWKHSVAVAVGAEKLAAVLGLNPPDYTFTAALLHDIGKIVLGTFVEVDAAPIIDLAFANGVSFEEFERRVLGIDHAEVGSVLLTHWNLPPALVDAVRWHHRPDCTGGDSVVVDLVHVADVLCMMGGIGIGRDGLHYRLSKDVVARFRLKEEMVERIVLQIHNEFNELHEVFVQREETE